MNLTRRSFLKGLLAAATVAATAKVGADTIAATIEDAGPTLCDKTTAALKAAFPNIQEFECHGKVLWSDGSYTTQLWSEAVGETEDEQIASLIDLLTRHNDQLAARPGINPERYKTAGRVSRAYLS